MKLQTVLTSIGMNYRITRLYFGYSYDRESNYDGTYSQVGMQDDFIIKDNDFVELNPSENIITIWCEGTGSVIDFDSVTRADFKPIKEQQ